MPGFDNGCVYFEKGIDPRDVSPVVNQMGTNGNLLIGSVNSPYVVCNTLASAGGSIAITNGPGTINLESSGNYLSWQTNGASTPLVVNKGFISNAGAAISYALPAVSKVGDVVCLVLDGSTSWTITQAANQQIRFGNLQTTLGVGGTLASTDQGDTIHMVCSVANLKWNVISSIGNITGV